MTESDLQAEVIRMARDLRLAVFHSTDARRDIGAGYPDLTIVGPGGVAFVELKSASGRLSADQVAWRYRLMIAGSIYRLWTPSDLAGGGVAALLGYLATEPSDRLIGR